MASTMLGRISICSVLFLISLERVCCQSSESLKCLSQSPISNGQVQLITDLNKPPENVFEDPYQTQVPVGTVLRYSCDIGYVLKGSNALFCEQDGLWSHSPPVCAEDCGLSLIKPQLKIANGEQSSAGEWPWMVAIYDNAFKKPICGGALIDSRTVITTAHCLVKNKSNYTLHFGRHNIRNDSGVIVRKILQIITHENFNPVTYGNDIALVKLESEVPYTDKIFPICLPDQCSSTVNLVQGNNGIVMGYGENEMQLTSNKLMMAVLPVQSRSTCVNSLKDMGFEMDIGPEIFCAGYPEGNIALCSGDDGAPFIFYDAKTNRYTLEGIFSFGFMGECGLPGKYSMFSKVSNYIDWINVNRRDEA